MRRPAVAPLLVLFAALAAIAVVAVVIAGGTPNNTDPSSRSNGDAGTLALYQWLARLGLPVQRMSGSFDVSGADVLVVADPTTTFTAAEASQVADLVRSGGELILTTERGGLPQSAELLGAVGAPPDVKDLVRIPNPLPASYDAGVALPIDPAGLVRRVPMRAGIDFDVQPDAAVPLLTRGSLVAGVAVPMGSGRAYVLGSPYPLSNLGLREGDSALLVLAMIERARGGHVVFDEFHHGEAGSGGAVAALSGPVGVAGGLAAAAILTFLLLSGRRLGRAVPGGDPARVPSATEYVEAMGALIERTAQRGGVADRYAEELKRRVGAATAIDPRLGDDAFLALLEAHSPAAAGVVGAALARCRELAGGRPSGAQLVALAQLVDEVEGGFAISAGAGQAEFRG